VLETVAPDSVPAFGAAAVIYGAIRVGGGAFGLSPGRP
jgi:hypothetical protein